MTSTVPLGTFTNAPPYGPVTIHATSSTHSTHPFLLLDGVGLPLD